MNIIANPAEQASLKSLNQIQECINNKNSFRLEAGAGAGKTYSLIESLKYIIKNKSAELADKRVACITYTNVAKDEILNRTDNHPLIYADTIHAFCWELIQPFQANLRNIIGNINKKWREKSKTIPINNQKVKYDFGVMKLTETELFLHHDDVTQCMSLLLQLPKFQKYLKSKFPIIFIDEYQDTSEDVVEIFLNHFKTSNKKNIIGFFGDAMQSIYDDGIGNLDKYKGDDDGTVNEVFKMQNRRSPQLVIDLANKLRTDAIKQEPSTDQNAPNMIDGVVKQGKILFLYSNSDDTDTAKSFLKEKENWNFDKKVESSTNIGEIKTKELNLTHNLIAEKAEFKNLMDIYDKDHILSFRDRLKKYIKENEITTDFSECTFGQVIGELQRGKIGRELKAISPTDTMQAFINNHEALYDDAKSIMYSKFSRIYVDKDQLIDDKKQNEDDENKKGSKRDDLIKHLYKIQTNISLYQNKKYNEFLRATDFRFKIEKISDKKTLKENIENLVNVDEKTIEDVINFAHEKEICLKDDKFNSFKEKNEYLYNRVKAVKFSEFQKLYDYLEGNTPFSTQHKIKGAEFDNVLVVLDNGGWNNYNFEKMFLGTASESVMNRTQKIFYVCCTRAKENLSVFFHNPDEQVIERAKEWFGNGNVINLDVL